MPRFSAAQLIFLLAGLIAALFASNLAGAHDHSSELEVFVAAEAFHASGNVRADEGDPWVDADVVFGLTKHQLRVFGEFFATPDERDLERLQIGFEFVPETVLWLGRFHQTASAWNTKHHHGQYLQTAITRPYIERWEDEGGFIPQHIAGALFESRRPIGAEGAIQLSGGIGAGPSLTSDKLEAINLIGANPGKHGLSVIGHLAYLPEYVGESSAGLLFAHDALTPGKSLLSRSFHSANADLAVYGVYLDWTVEPWRIVGANYYVDVDLDRPYRNESFISGYLQVERQLLDQFTVFGRMEDSSRMQESSYVALFNDHDSTISVGLRRQALGARWDYARRQALTLEIAHIVSLSQQSNQVRAQWSAAIP